MSDDPDLDRLRRRAEPGGRGTPWPWPRRGPRRLPWDEAPEKPGRAWDEVPEKPGKAWDEAP